jgi:hypothetical protein
MGIKSDDTYVHREEQSELYPKLAVITLKNFQVGLTNSTVFWQWSLVNNDGII